MCLASLVTLILVQAVVVVVLQVSHELLRGDVVVVLKQGLERLLPVLPVGSLTVAGTPIRRSGSTLSELHHHQVILSLGLLDY